jgi:hypothetical protein
LEGARKSLREVEERIRCMTTAAEIAPLQGVLKSLHPLHSLWVEFYSKAIPITEHQRLYKKAGSLSRQFARLAVQAYPPNYPPVGVEHYRAGRLLLYADNRPKALLHLQRALKVLSLYYRLEDSDFLRHIRDTVEGLKWEAHTGQRVLHFN